MTAPQIARLIGLLAVLGALAGCGAAERIGDRIAGRTLTVYFSGPMHGASSESAAAALNGARLALAQARGRIGKFRIAFKVLDDSTTKAAGWDPVQTTTDARIVVQDPTAVGYLGDYNSGASAVSIPLLNRAGIAQISPASSAVGLTSTGPGFSPGEPAKYYPLGTRTFARVVPSDAIQAVVQVRLARAMGCRSMFVLEDGEVDGEDGALSFALTADSTGLRVLGVDAFQRAASSYLSLATSVAQSGADCVLISAIHEHSAARVTAAVAGALPSATILASNGLADSAYIDQSDGGIPSSIDGQVLVTSPALDAAAYPPAGRAFLDAYARAYGPAPPAAIFGYEAMSLMLSAIDRATDHGHKAAERSKVVAAILSTRGRRGAIGTYSIDANGDTTIRGYGVYGVVDGRLLFREKLDG